MFKYIHTSAIFSIPTMFTKCIFAFRYSIWNCRFVYSSDFQLIGHTHSNWGSLLGKRRSINICKKHVKNPVG